MPSNVYIYNCLQACEAWGASLWRPFRKSSPDLSILEIISENFLWYLSLTEYLGER